MNKKGNKTMDELTFKRIKNLGLDEPSADFTQKIMQAVLAEATTPVSVVRPRNYWYWLSALIPAIIVVAWYLDNTYQWTGGAINHFFSSLANMLQPSLSAFFTSISQLKSISIQPIVFVSFAAILSLLIIEEVVRRARHTI
jgi:hypothetical protein